MKDDAPVAVIGSHGFVGSALVRWLLAAGHTRVIAVDKLADRRPEILPDDPRVARVAENARRLRLSDIGSPKLVYYLCAAPFVPDSFADPDGTEDNNVQVLREFLTNNKDATSLSIVYGSSGEVYGNVPVGCADEQQPTVASDEMSPYGRSRVGAERVLFELCPESRIRSVAVRLFNVVGPRATQPYFVPEMIRQLMKNGVVCHGDLAPVRDFVWIDDAVAAVAAAFQLCRTKPTAINVATGVGWSMAAVLALLLSIAGREDATTEVDNDRLRPIELARLVGCPDRARETLGWQSKTRLEDALRRTFQWYLRAGSWSYERGLK